MPQLLFGGMIAFILLGLYVWSIVSGACEASPIAGCKDRVPAFTANMQFLLNSVGGLISATVVGVLGATKPAEFPAEGLFRKNLTGTVQTIAGYMPSLYILVWIICGTYMVVYGFVLYSDDNLAPAFSAQAKMWLGTALAAVYAYFGIRPNGATTTPPPTPSPPTP